MTDDRELEDLTNLVKHPGWYRFVAILTKEWQEQIDIKLRSALQNTDDALAAGQMRQVVAAKAAIERMLKWPDERIKAIQRKDTAGINVEALSRGGY